MTDRIPVGVSHCLLGTPVRFDGGHKHWDWCTETLAEYFEFLPVCPEVESGMPVPRDAIRQVAKADGVHLIASKNLTQDVTQQLETYSKQKVSALSHLCGFIFMKGSPTCGLERVKVYDEAHQMPYKKGVGVFARHFIERYPLIPAEDSGRLQDAAIRENFMLRVFLYHQWVNRVSADLTAKKLIDFHSQHKFILLAHSPMAYKAAGQKLANLKAEPLPVIAHEYISLFMAGLKKVASKKNHSNVLQHLVGFIKQNIPSEQKREILEAIEEYRRGDIPLLVPMTLLKHYVNRYGQPYLKAQSYWQPHPRELKLRSHL